MTAALLPLVRSIMFAFCVLAESRQQGMSMNGVFLEAYAAKAVMTPQARL